MSASIGRGGMGEVFAARRQGDQLEVAIKVVSRSVVDDTLMARLEREAIAARRIKSAFVPELYDVDRTEEGELFLVMRLLTGASLSHRLRERGVLMWEEVRLLVDDVLSGLMDAHAAGVVHRDLKPGNIFLERIDAPTLPSNQPIPADAVTTREHARILDFGVCKLDASDGEKLTMTGEAVGTVSYMAPEQIRGASGVDGRADLYALATVAFESLCGRMPFDAEMQMALLAEKLESRPRRLRDLARVTVPTGLDALLDKALSRKATDRFASAEEMLRAWRALGPPAVASNTALPVVTQSGVNYPTETGVTAGVRRAPHMGSRVGLLIAGLAVLIGVLALAVTLHHRTPTARHAASATSSPAPLPTLAATPTVALSVVELADTPLPDAGVNTAKTSRPVNIRKRPPVHAPAIASSQGPHITTIPRY